MANIYGGNTGKPYHFHSGSVDAYRVYGGSDLLWEFTPTTTTTTTLAPVGFNISYTCTGGNATITISSFTAGSGTYQANISPQTSEANAFSGSFMDVSSPYNYTSISNGTWYIVVRDKYNTSNATYHTITFSCTTTTTTTTTTTQAPLPMYNYEIICGGTDGDYIEVRIYDAYGSSSIQNVTYDYGYGMQFCSSSYPDVTYISNGQSYSINELGSC